MLSNLNIFEIFKDGLKAVKGESKLFPFIIIFWLSPVSIACLADYFNYHIPKDISSDIIEGIGLFAGLMFTLLFVVTSNYKTRKEQLSKDQNDETKRYLNRYLNFTQNSVSLISYSILIIGCVILSLIVYVSLLDGCNVNVYVIRLVNWLLIIQLIQFLIVIIRILKEMYAMLYDDIMK